MSRIPTLLTCAAACAVSTLALASASGATAPAREAHAATVDLRHTAVGTILTSSSGFTLYEFTRDHGAHNSCLAVKGCAAAWPALETSGTPTAGPGVESSLLSTTRLPAGARQVTYAGHPLYLFAGDEKPGATSYVGVNEFGGAWDAVSAHGGAVK